MIDNYLPPFSVWKANSQVIDENSNLYVKFDYEFFIHTIKLMICCVQIDDNYYLARYPDVAEAIKNGLYRDARHHFVSNGYFEGRIPFRIAVNSDWYLETNPDVAGGIVEGRLESAEEHFTEHGYVEGRLPSTLDFE